jgi:hypothetical protein
MAFIQTNDKNKLFLHVKHELGYPLRPFEITDEMMMSYLEMVIEDYSSVVNGWLIQQQWIGLEGLDKQNSDFLSAFTTKSNDYIKSFTYAYSKQVGLGTNAPAANNWELKRDYITISAGTQHYIIPKGREVNEVLWETPAEISSMGLDPLGYNAMTPGYGGWSMYSQPMRFITPVYYNLLAAQDRGTKQRVLQSNLTYRITGLETGEKMLHLYPVPGGINEIRDVWGKSYSGKKIFYWYYETNNKNKKSCLNNNKDIVKLPSDSPTNVLKWDNINDVAKQQIRDLLISKVKMVIGGVRGFFSGEISATEKGISMDYRHLLDEGIQLKEKTLEIIKEQLDKLSQVNLTEERAKIAQNVNDAMRFQPVKKPIVVY